MCLFAILHPLYNHPSVSMHGTFGTGEMATELMAVQAFEKEMRRMQERR
jgi:hypothetical protein